MDACQRKLMNSVGVHNAASLFQEADFYGAKTMRDYCLRFVCDDFDRVSKTPAFEELCRSSL